MINKDSGVARNLSWGVQIHKFVLKIPLNTKLLLLKQKLLLYMVLRKSVWGCKCPIAPPLATLLNKDDFAAVNLKIQ
jgi:hypothetical protein